MDVYKWLMEQIGSLVVYGAGVTGFAYFLFKLFAKHWMETQFKVKLDNLKHQHDVELQKLKVEIDSLLGGSLKLQEKEFVILPEIWGRLDEAYGRSHRVLSPLQRYADLERMAEAEMEEFLEGADLRAFDKARLRASREKNKLYQEIMFYQHIGKARSANREFAIYLARNGIFLPDNIKSACKEVQDFIWVALSSKEIGREANDGKMEQESWSDLEGKIKPLIKIVEDHIRARLLSHAQSQR